MKVLETERLILRPFVINDVQDVFDYASLETVGPNAGWAVHQDIEHTTKIVEMFIKENDVLAVYHKKDNKVIGSIGLHKKNIDGKTVYELGYVLSTHYEGQGIMTEAARRVLKYAFEEVKALEVVVYHFIENNKSRRVIEKLGFTYIDNIEYETLNYGIKLSKRYVLTQNDYNNMEE